jgi:hypothetical protein
MYSSALVSKPRSCRSPYRNTFYLQRVFSKSFIFQDSSKRAIGELIVLRVA